MSRQGAFSPRERAKLSEVALIRRFYGHFPPFRLQVGAVLSDRTAFFFGTDPKQMSTLLSNPAIVNADN